MERQKKSIRKASRTSLETIEELDELYRIYFGLIRKEIECTDKLLATDDLGETHEYASETLRYSREASAVARAIKDIEDFKE